MFLASAAEAISLGAIPNWLQRSEPLPPILSQDELPAQVLWPLPESAGFDRAGAGCVKTTAYFRDVVRQKHPGIEEAWILRVMAEPLETRRQADGRFVLWALVPEAQNRALRVVTLDDRETVHNAFFDRGFLKARTRSQPSPPAEKPAP